MHVLRVYSLGKKTLIRTGLTANAKHTVYYCAINIYILNHFSLLSHSEIKIVIPLPVPPRVLSVPVCEEVLTPPKTVIPCPTGAWKLL